MQGRVPEHQANRQFAALLAGQRNAAAIKHVNRRTHLHSRCPEPVGKSRVQLLTGKAHPHGLELLGSGASHSEIIEDYPFLEEEDILAALEYAAIQADHPILIAA